MTSLASLARASSAETRAARARAVERADASNANQRARAVVARAAIARSSSTRARGIARARLVARARALARRAAARSAASRRVRGDETRRRVASSSSSAASNSNLDATAHRRRVDASDVRSFTTRSLYRDGARDARSESLDVVHFPYFDRSAATAATYAVIASSLDVPSRAFHASHFALPLKSIIPGRATFTSPTFACLNSAYSSSISSFVVCPSSVVARGFRSVVALASRVASRVASRARRASSSHLRHGLDRLRGGVERLERRHARSDDDDDSTRCAAHRRATRAPSPSRARVG